MTRPIFGVRLPCAGVLASPEAMTRVALAAEGLGYDIVWVHDYIIWNKVLDRLHISCGSAEAVQAARDDYPPVFFEAITNLAYLAGITQRIHLGTAVLVLPYRNAVVTAKQLACIDVLSGGRLELGIGQGSGKSTLNEDFEVLGIPRAEKIRRTREAFEAMRAIWNEDSPSFDGQFVRFPAATIYPKPIQRPTPRVWMGGSADRSLEMVVDYADAWLSWGYSPGTFPDAIAGLGERLEAQGRPASDLLVASELEVMVAGTTAEAREGARRTLQALGEHYADAAIETSRGRPDDPLADAWEINLIGSAPKVRDDVERFVAAGCGAFELKFIYHDIDHLLRQMDEFATVVLAGIP